MHRYEDYLDSFITPHDLFYLTDVAMMRRQIEYGCDPDKIADGMSDHS